MRSIELIKGLLKRFDPLAQFFALISLDLKASMDLLQHVHELLLGVLIIIIITPTSITFTFIIITHIIFYLGRLCHEACRWSVEDGGLVVDGDAC